MYINFSTLNQVLKGQGPSTKTQLAQRLINISNAISDVATDLPSEWGRSYAGVQQLQYSASGLIEDVTPEEAISVPNAYIANSIRDLKALQRDLSTLSGQWTDVPGEVSIVPTVLDREQYSASTPYVVKVVEQNGSKYFQAANAPGLVQSLTLGTNTSTGKTLGISLDMDGDIVVARYSSSQQPSEWSLQKYTDESSKLISLIILDEGSSRQYFMYCSVEDPAYASNTPTYRFVFTVFDYINQTVHNYFTHFKLGSFATTDVIEKVTNLTDGGTLASNLSRNMEFTSQTAATATLGLDDGSAKLLVLESL